MGNKNSTEMSKEFNYKCIPKIEVAYAEVNGHRNAMEDRIIDTHIFENWYMYGVLDGHGGSECVEDIQINLPLFFKKAFQKYNGMPQDDVLINTCIDFDISHCSDYISGSTASIIFINIYTNELVSLNIGDSSTFCYSNDKLLFEAEEHKPDNINEHERIIKSGNFVSSGRINKMLAVSRAFGDCDYKLGCKIDMTHEEYMKYPVIAVPTIIRHIIPNKSHIFITCDGVYESNVCSKSSLYNMIVKREIQNDKLRHEKLCKKICEALDIVVDNGSQDNVSIIYINYDIDLIDNMGYSKLYPGIMCKSIDKNIASDKIKQDIRKSYIKNDFTIELYKELRIKNLKNLLLDLAKHNCNITEMSEITNIPTNIINLIDYYGYVECLASLGRIYNIITEINDIENIICLSNIDNKPQIIDEKNISTNNLENNLE